MQPGAPRLVDVYEAACNGEEYNTGIPQPYFHGARSLGDGTVIIDVFPDGPAETFVADGVEWDVFSDRVAEWLSAQRTRSPAERRR